jgi:hypothetical protein
MAALLSRRPRLHVVLISAPISATFSLELLSFGSGLLAYPRSHVPAYSVPPTLSNGDYLAGVSFVQCKNVVAWCRMRRCATQAVACWVQETIGTHLRGDFGTRFLQRQLDLLPLRLASFRAYASSIALPRHLQGSIPGPWLAVTGRDSHPLDYAALPSRNVEVTRISCSGHLRRSV